jgi:hypothetical protein
MGRFRLCSFSRWCGAVVTLGSVCLLFSFTLVSPASAKPRPSPAVRPPTLGVFPDNVRWGFSPASTKGVCDPAGTSRFSFAAAGALTVGAYPGTFEETGNVTIGPQPGGPEEFFSTPLVTLHWTFAIHSPAGEVRGVGDLPTLLGLGAGVCKDFLGSAFFGTGYFHYGGAFVHYEARITTAAGVYLDRGLASVTVHDFTGSIGPNSSTIGGFRSELSETIPLRGKGKGGGRPGKGCGDKNHDHAKRSLCRK